MEEVRQYGTISDQDKLFAVIAHVCVLAGSVIPFGNIIGPLVIWLIYKDKSQFIEEHAREALNFAISVMIYLVICVVLMVVVVGFFGMIALGIFNLIVSIIAIVKSANGEFYQYPLCIRFVKKPFIDGTCSY